MRRIEPDNPASEDRELALVAIPAGWFLMGCEGGRDAMGTVVVAQDSERPVHRAWVDEFLLATCQVTNGEYDRYVAATGMAPAPFAHDSNLNQAAQPVVGVSWFEATRYCEWLRANTGKKFRLPTEAEWERAARGGREGELYPWGDAPPQALPDYAERCARYWTTGPEPVGRGAANGYGLLNMCDNVHEWCSDWYSADYYAISSERNPRGPEAGERRASRGGSWRHHVKMSRCAARSSIPPGFQYADYGFRVACDAAIV
ncbi:MAG: SUMF1/EgtB/PvdO family nonheme iron enzyme [Terriglobales bacterium]